MTDLTTLIEGSDVDGLIRRIDGICAAREWDDLLELRDRCVEAVNRGKQLWGVAQFAEYRTALEGPADYAGRMVKEGAGRFALGPLWEVAASTHTWEELESQVADERLRTLVAHERILREDEVPVDAVDPHVLEVSLQLEPWEPQYAVAVYKPDRADFPERDRPDLDWVDLGDSAERLDDDDALEALTALVQPWSEQSNGRVDAVAVAGTAEQAIRTMGPHRVRAAEANLATALAVMAWTGASGGAHGRRRGSPVGRMHTWWAVAALLGWDDIDDAAGLGRDAAALRWILWDPGDQVGGWGFHLAVEDPGDGLAWAVSAVDAI